MFVESVMEQAVLKARAKQILSGIQGIGDMDPETMIDIPKKAWSILITYVRYLEDQEALAIEAKKNNARLIDLEAKFDAIADIVTSAGLGELENDFESEPDETANPDHD